MRADAILNPRRDRSFRRRHGSRECRFRLENDELRCLIGPNGAGKSTFFKCLTGLLTPSEGSIYLQGEDCTGIHPPCHRPAGRRHQDPGAERHEHALRP